MLEIYYVAFVLVGIILTYYGSANGSREVLSLISAGFILFWYICLAIRGPGVTVSLPMSVSLFGLWIFLSICWSEHKEKSIKGALLLLSSFIFFSAAQTVDKAILLLCSFLPAPGIAATILFENIKTFNNKPGGIFGNSNHAGIYLSLNVFIGLWLAQELTYWILPFAALCVYGIYKSGCRTAFISLGAGIISMFYFYGHPILGTMFFIAVFLIVYLGNLYNNLSNRDTILRNIIKLIVKKPIFGWGINSYCAENWRAQPIFYTHRAHNDYLEFAFEMGIVGLVLFLNILFSVRWQIEPLLSAQLVVALVSCLAFFTFREVHTASPVLAILAVLIPADYHTLYLSPWFAYLLMLIIPYFLWIYAGRHAMGVYWWAKGSRKKDREEALDCILKALEYDCNGQYLTRAIFFAASSRPELAWDLTCKMLYQYDGCLIMDGVFDQASRMAYRMGAIGLADIYNQKCLKVNSAFVSAIKFREHLDKTISKMKGVQLNAPV